MIYVTNDYTICYVIFIFKDLYIKILADAKQDFTRLFPDDNFVFQQDGATSHTAKTTLSWIERSGIQFWKPCEWPPNSPDLNPLDYYVWKALQELVYQEEIKSIHQLKARVRWAWDKLDQRKISEAIDDFSKRLKMVVSERGGHIESYLI